MLSTSIRLFSFIREQFAVIHDEFYWISQINKASVVSNSREKLLDEATAKLAARGIAAVEKEATSMPQNASRSTSPTNRW